MAVDNVQAGLLHIASRAGPHDLGTREDMFDLEFSDCGRDPRFLPGWWIVPGLLLAAALTAGAAATL